MPTISFDLDANGKKLQSELDKSNRKVEKLQSELDKFNRKVEKLEGDLAKMGKAGERAGRGMASGAGEAESGFAQAGRQAMLFVGSLVGVNGVQAAVGKVLDLAKKAYGEVRRMERMSLDQQTLAVDAEAQFFSNNPQINDAKGRQLLTAARKASEVFGGEGAYQAALTGITDLRSNTPGATEQMQMDALMEAARMKRLDRSVNLSTQAVGLVKLAEKEKISISQAANMSSMYGAYGGGKIADMVAQIGKLTTVSDLAKAPSADILALHGTLTGALSDTQGDETTTTITNLLTRINSRDVKIGGKRVRFDQENAIDRFVAINERIQSGEFGDVNKAYAELTSGLGRESASATLAIQAIGANKEKLAEARKAISGARDTKESMAEMSLQRAQRANPSVEIVQGVREGKQQAEGAARMDVQGASREAAAQQVAQFQEEFGIINPLEDPAGKLKMMRDILSRTKGRTPEEFMQAEKLRVFKDAFSPGAIESMGMKDPYAVRRSRTLQEAQLAALESGAIKAKGGLSKGEGSLLAAAGLSEERIAALSSQGTDPKQRESFAAALDRAVREAIANLKTMEDPEKEKAAWAPAIESLQLFAKELGNDRADTGLQSSAGLAIDAGQMTAGEWAARERLRIFRESAAARTPRAGARDQRLAQLGDLVPDGEEATRKDIMAAATPEDVAQAALRSGAVDFSDGIDKLERAILQGAGANAKQLDQMQQQWKDGMTEAFDRSLQKLVQELRANPPAPARPPSQEVE